MSYIMRFIFVLISVITNMGYSQINYVLNPSFEDFNNCPTMPNQITFADYWSTIDTTGVPAICTPQYFNACSSFMGVPIGIYNYQYPKTGNAFASVGMQLLLVDSSTSTTYDYREYLQGRFYQNLIAGGTYCVKYYTVAADSTRFRCNNQAAYIDDGSIDSSPPDCMSPFTSVIPQLKNNSIIVDDSTWIKLETTFVANGTERFITVGNFSSNANTSYIIFSNNYPSGGGIYLIDDVSVIDYNLPAFAGTDALIANGDSIYLGRPNEIGPECRWWANGIAMNDSSLGFWAKPTQPTQYVLQQKICGNIKYDTVFVNVSGNVGLAPPTKAEGVFKLVPNPNNGSFIISSTQATYNNVIIYSIDGKEVYNNKLVFTKGNANLDLDLPNGVYHVQLIGSGGIASQKLVISK
jgi:hypothetical protein